MTGRLVLRGLGSVGDLAGPRSLAIEDGRIAALDAEAEAGAGAGAGADALDARGLVAVPGFIELQLNGAFGHDFTTDPASMWAVGLDLARDGVTAFLPTIVTSPPGTVDAALAAWQAAPATPRGAVPLGVHVEGPFIAPARAGAHDPALLRDPDPGEIGRWAETGALRILTLAPERPGALEAIAQLSERGVVTSIGHTDADAPTTAAAIAAGARYATHLFNAMSPLGHRAPGAPGALLADPRVTVGLILDRHHLDPIVVGLVARLAAGRVSIVSDAIAALGLPEGPNVLGGREVTVRDGAVRLPDGTLAGSATPLSAGVRAFASITGSARAAVEAVTSTPARLLGLADGRGTLAVGGRADIVLLDENLEVRATIIGGDLVHASKEIGWR